MLTLQMKIDHVTEYDEVCHEMLVPWVVHSLQARALVENVVVAGNERVLCRTMSAITLLNAGAYGPS